MVTNALVTPGWDVKNLPLAERVYASVESSLRLASGLRLTYRLQNAEPNQVYTVGFDIFDAHPPVEYFGLDRWGGHSAYNREGEEHSVDIFVVALNGFRTDANGNGEATFPPLNQAPYDLSRVPSGIYNLQLFWAREAEFACFYRTGTRYGEGFVQIVIP
jgi:hypothetical protein